MSAEGYPLARTVFDRWAKAVFDRCLAAVTLALLAPLLVAIVVAVKIDSPGPALYKQQRIGKDGRAFLMLKFRSMVPGADQLAANVSPVGDPRVTRVGKLLRRWYLDELPQLVNVLKGDMSLVGPRPETPEFVARYTQEERQVLSVRPGVAGPSTLAFMDEAALLAAADDAESYYTDTMLHDRVRLDLGYLRQASLWYDIRLLVRQVLAILGARANVTAVATGAVAALAAMGTLILSLGPDLLDEIGHRGVEDLAHATAYALLAGSLLVVLSRRQRRTSLARGLAVAVAVVLSGAALEAAQLLLHRDAQWRDVGADAIGTSAVLLLWVMANMALRAARTPSKATSIE